MAIATLDDLLSATAASTAQRIHWTKQAPNSATGAAVPITLWPTAGMPGAGSGPGNTTTGVVPTGATAGALAVTAAGSGNTLHLARFDAAGPSSAVVGVFATLYDRLWHAGAFACSSLTTFSLTPAALTRQTSGVGVEAWAEVTAAFAATATTITLSYTNTAGTSGRTATLDASASGLALDRMIPFRLQAGDLGIKSVESITVGGVTNSTGQFNLVLLKRLALSHHTVGGAGQPGLDAFGVGLQALAAGTATPCLALMVAFGNTGVVGTGGTVHLVQGATP